MAEIQRTRLLTAAVGALDELGYADVTVAQITARARISRRTFYELFDNREGCITAVFEDALDRVRREMAIAAVDGLRWHDRVRSGLAAILNFFDREPVLARVCLVQSARGNETILARRTAILTQLARVIDEGRSEALREADAPALTAEGLVGAAHAILYERVLRRGSEPLTSLLPALMSMIVLPYLGTAAARREQSRPKPAPLAAEEQTAHEASATETDWLQGLPMRLTYRTICVLRVVSERPGISNRTVGDEAGVADQGQISKLLARLARLGLIVNSGEGHVKGEANAWRLTPAGAQITQSIHQRGANHAQAV